MSYRNTPDMDDLFSSLSFVDEAVKNMNFTSLDQDMRDSLRSFFEEVDIDPAKKVDKAKTVRQAENIRNHASAGKKANRTPRFLKNPKGKTAGMICKIGGMAGSAVFGIATIATLFTGLFTGSPGEFITPAVFLVICIGLMIHGIKTTGLIDRFERYKIIIGDRTYIDINALASGVDRSKQFVLDDLYRMISKKYFYNAHIDPQGTTLMLDQASYEQYMTAQNAYYERTSNSNPDPEPEPKSSVHRNSQEIDKAMSEGEMYLKAIRHANDLVPDPVISDKLDRLENVIRRIFTVLEQKPDQLPKLRKFMKYYMPTTLKLVQTYQELDAQEVEGENIQKSKKEIEENLDTINTAYEKLLDSFFEEAAMDVSSDISVLQTMLAQEGLTEDNF